MKEKLKEIFEDILNSGLQAEQVSTENTESWDSLNHLNLILAMEEEFGVDIPPDDFPELYKNFNTVLEYLKEKTLH